ncbi:MAG: hypothetical protein LBF83_04820 [Spirochaetaceae bacterium]|jgi:hypothetical protein|nr:hypothetical protein [Spirochaetaceae bacterium]
MPFNSDLTGIKLFKMTRNITKLALIIAVAVFEFAGCAPGTVPVFVTDVDIGDFSLPWYSPPNDLGGTNTMQANMEGLYINQSYMTSDGITHIVLKGTIDNGIPHGLLWSDQAIAGYPRGTYGYNMNGAGYGGYGDFQAGTLSGTAGVGGSFAIGSLDFSAEWVMAAPYSAFVIRGLVGDNVTITETNESLYLYSYKYRSEPQPTKPTNEIINYSSGRPQKITSYETANNDKPNSFNKIDSLKLGKERGGYMVLISKKANPAAAMIEVAYRGGTKKKYNIDYSGVNFNEIELTSVSFQTPTPIGAYVIDNPATLDGDTLMHSIISPTIYAGSISMSGGTVSVPLYLRPLYEPVKKDISDADDPTKNTTNMIHRIWFDMIPSTPSYSKDNFELKWDDVTQAITMYLKQGAVPLYDGETVEITIHAELRMPYFDTGNTANIREFTFTFTVMGDTPP